MSRVLVCIPFLVFFALLYPRSEPEQGPAALVEEPVQPANPNDKAAPQLPAQDVLTFIEKSLQRYDKDIKGYTGTLYKQERVQGKLRPVEVVQFAFREKPHSVFMKWVEGAGDATAVLFVKGENNNLMLAKPKLLPFLTWREEPAGAKAKANGRYTIDEFGIRVGTQRVLDAWIARKKDNVLHVEFEGIVKVEKAGNKECYKIHRSRLPRPEDDGVLDVVLYFDRETLLQVGTVLRGKDNQLIAEYFFRDLRPNPDEILQPGYFSEKLLSKK